MKYHEISNRNDRYIETILTWKGWKALADLGDALLVVKDKPAGRAIADVMEQYGFKVDFVNTGMGGLKKIQYKDRYAVLITQLILDQISGTALMMEIKKKQPVFALGINNCSAACRSIAKVSGFDVIVDSGTNPALICKYLLNAATTQMEQTGN